MINKIENQLYLALTDSYQFPFLEVLVICSINYDFTIHGRCYTYAVISLVKITGWINWITIQKLHCNSNYQFSGVKFNVLQQLSRLFLPHISRLESPYLPPRASRMLTISANQKAKGGEIDPGDVYIMLMFGHQMDKKDTSDLLG